LRFSPPWARRTANRSCRVAASRPKRSCRPCPSSSGVRQRRAALAPPALRLAADSVLLNKSREKKHRFPCRWVFSPRQEDLFVPRNQACSGPSAALLSSVVSLWTTYVSGYAFFLRCWGRILFLLILLFEVLKSGLS